MILEVCTDSIDSVRASSEGGASRVELCSALGEGGVTPSLGLIKAARRVNGLILHVLIRPRGGDFIYDEAETDCMIDDIKNAVNAGADGIVIGALKPDGSIDTDTCNRIVEACGHNVNITFHRAFDLCRDPFECLETIIRLGFNRILTSGLSTDAWTGRDLLRDLNKKANGRIIILPGGGISPANAAGILKHTGCTELHGSLRSKRPSQMKFYRQEVSMGTPGTDEYTRFVTDPMLVKNTLNAMNSINNDI